MEEMPLPTEADLRAEAAALAPPPSWQVRSWEEFHETLEGRVSGLKALRCTARAEAYRLSQGGRQSKGLPTPAACVGVAGPTAAAAAAAAALMTMADRDAPFLLAFLRHAKFDTAAACARLRKFAAFLAANPWTLAPSATAVDRVYGPAGPIDLLPRPATGGERVFALIAKRINGMTSTDLAYINRATFWALVGMLRTPGGQLGGMCFLDDMDGLGFGILKLIGSDQNRVGWQMLQTVLPVRLRGLHVLRQPAFFSLMWLIAKAVMSRKVRDRLQVYGNDTVALVQALGADAVPVSCGGAAVVGPDATVAAVFSGIADTPWLDAP
ncbi:hypothetical protein BU14_0120s0031 [Porphyra umbilicalis]|uniref:CRAL-TRIO domain-containing protein n=1 Tax=Porphyra umbilicalis TaxID=2786 RepID=A0A1X6PBB3_PORUM|nr:hypothetical protein BU14_0120s0031 [Porphyra umbilicalis]|eukprot:OSX78148.1 hypothetical protein BU14_0120s0031 [Porphyra umbilicalis]